MIRRAIAVLLTLALHASPSNAIQLRWADGSHGLTFTTTTRCTLVVEKGPAESTLPGQWYLSWVASGCAQLPVEISVGGTAGVAFPCSTETQSAADRESQTVRMRLCSDSEGAVAFAMYVLTLPAGSAGQFQVISVPSASDPQVSPQRSNIVSFNGGVNREQPLTVVSAANDHSSVQLTVQARGRGLHAPTSASVVAPDTSWRVPLEIVSSSDSTMEARADVPVLLPDAVLEVTAADGSVATALMPSAQVQVTSLSLPNYSLFLDPTPGVSTKDFAFFYNRVPAPPGQTGWRSLFHLMYIRTGGSEAAETKLGHAWSWDLTNWNVDLQAFTTDTTPWNTLHVWAPSVIQRGNKYQMFYTGVDALEDQRIGVVATTDLDTTGIQWGPRTMVWQASSANWIVRDPPLYSGKDQCRDPYVMGDPADPSRLLMFYTANDKPDSATGGMAIGLARSAPGSTTTWEDRGYYQSTQLANGGVGNLEGPHAFSVNGTNTGWRLMFSRGGGPPNGGQNSIRFLTLAPGKSLTDTSTAAWPGPAAVLKTYLNGDTTVFGWNGSEQLNAGGVDFLAGFTAWGPTLQGIAITRMSWNGSNFTLQQPSVTAVNDVGSNARDVRLRLRGLRPGAKGIEFQIETPLTLDARLEVFDVTGRQVAEIHRGRIPNTGASIRWDLVDDRGRALSSGVYFARLSFPGGLRLARIPIVR